MRWNSQRMREARVDSGLTLRQLAVLAHCTTASIRNYETGESVPGAIRAGLIADALGLSVDDLLCKEG